MKIDRRNFLSFAIGGAVGTALSPIPWKLMDDISIWSQNWPWTPVPPNGAVSYAKTVCTLCPGRCGITVRKVGRRAVKIDGIDGHPINDGGTCLLGQSGLQLLDGPWRVPSPMKRVGARGSGRWEAISWNQAIAEATGRMNQIRQAGNPQRLAAIAGHDSETTNRLLARLLTVFGSPNVMTMPSMEDAFEMALKQTMGGAATAGFDVDHADFILSFGSGIIEGWGSPVYMFRAHSRWRDKGATLIQIEPRLSTTAAKADQWVAIRPGTEAVLALGFAAVIASENRFNAEFVGGYSANFGAWKSAILSRYTPDAVAGITGVDRATIVSLARRFAAAKRPLAIWGRGKGRTPGSLSESLAFVALNALVGNINREGGLIAVPTDGGTPWPEPTLDAVATKGLATGRIDGAGSKPFAQARSLINRFAPAVADGKAAVDMLLVAGANPRFALPDTASVKKAFDRIPYVVSFSPYMDETAFHADLILPDHNYLERFTDVGTPIGFPRPIKELARPVVAASLKTRPLGDTIIALAKALGGGVAQAFPWANHQACLKATLGADWKTLSDAGSGKVYVVDDHFAPVNWNAAFKTSSGRFEFPTAHAAPAEPAGNPKDYPLVLVPYDSMRLTIGAIANPPFMTKTVSDTVLKKLDGFVEINPETARKFGLTDGCRAMLATPKGHARIRVHHFDGIAPGVVAMPRGLGHSAYDDYIAGKGVNVNDLMGPVEDPASGLDAAWGIRATLSKA